jgi:pimeloyl-ACP methyl ester carboxylesterase
MLTFALAAPSPAAAGKFAAAAGGGHAPALETDPPRGRLLLRSLPDDPEFRFHLYVPVRGARDAALFVTVHGISLDARQHAKRFAPLAEEYGIALLAPHFAETRFPDYQRLGRAGHGERSDRMLDRAVAAVAAATGARGERVHLFGYSGGGQFVHRYAMAHPERVAGYVVGAAGWYTFPDAAARYPRGIRPNPELPDVVLDPRRFLAVPGAVVVGERDIHPGTALRKTERVARQQGATRFERGRNWVAAMNIEAEARGLPPHFAFQELARSPHSFSKSMRRGAMGAWVFQRLFGPAAGDPDELVAGRRAVAPHAPCPPTEGPFARPEAA